MKIPDKVLDVLHKAIQEKFGANLVSLDIESIEIDEEHGVIRMELRVQTASDPAEIAKGYFGLTGAIRRGLGSEWKDFFPVITPVVGKQACA